MDPDGIADGLLAATLAELDRTAPLSHWSRDLLFSVPARRGWVPPDIAPLPFPYGSDG